MVDKKKNSISIQINSNQVKDGAVYYTLDLTDSSTGDKWTVVQRYSFMKELHEKIEQIISNPDRLPKFPKKKWFGNMDKEFISKRQAELQYYYNMENFQNFLYDQVQKHKFQHMMLDHHDIDQIKPLKDFLFKGRDVAKQQAKKTPQKPEQASDQKKYEEYKKDDPNNLPTEKKNQTIQQKQQDKQAMMGNIVDLANQKLVQLSDNYHPPDKEYMTERRNLYSSKITLDAKTILLNNFYNLPRGNDRNTVTQHEPSLICSNQDFLKSFQMFAEEVCNQLENPKTIADPSSIVHQFGNQVSIRA